MQFQSRGFKAFNDVTNLRNTLLQLQKKVGEDIDFYLLGFRTFYSKKGENKYKPVNDTSIFSKNANFIANIDIKQAYKIEVCKKSQKPERAFGFKLFCDESTILRAILLCNNKIKYHDSIKEEIYQELYKTMILQGYLIGIREYNKLSQQIDAFVFSLKQGKIIPKLTLNIGVGVASVEGVDGVLKCFYSLQDDTTQQSTDSFTPRICMQALHKGDEIFAYTKPINGQVGRNLKGEFIQTNAIQTNAIQTDASIRARSDSNIIKYQATKDGFLKEIKPFYYIISDELNTTQTDPKETASSQKESLNIDGQTHSNAKIQTDIAFIGSHRGEIKAHTVVIDVLEKGSVEAKVAYINSTLGGKIIADYIYIKDVRSYNEIYPRFSLVVDNILGEHNTFELNPAKFAFTRRDRLEYVMLSDQIKIRLRHLKKQMDEVYAYLLASQGKAHKIQHDAEEKPEEKLPKNLQCIVEQYEKALEQYKNLLKEYKDIINLYYTNEVRLKGIDEGALLAKMIIRGEISEPETMVKFKAYTGKREETLKTILSQATPARLFEVEKEGDFFRLRSYQEYDPELLNWMEEKRPQKES
ncbi:flagellar assembly protein A [uncultured Helicobacter sp.]|uniref:flagellar assembly protein A n=1 Tax=uncultured Helicobacter sp. TaxID=175537 RepID=UPI00260D0D1E|nr:flagellar assembly protein A [uncultured Helicobacter sp.]